MRAAIVFSTLLFSSALAAPTFKSAPAIPVVPAESTAEDELHSATAPLNLSALSFANTPTLPIRSVPDTLKTNLAPVTDEAAGLITDASIATGLTSKIPGPVIPRAISAPFTTPLESEGSSELDTLLTKIEGSLPVAARNTINLTPALSSSTSTLSFSFTSLISSLQSADHMLDSYSATTSHASDPLAAYSNLASDMSTLFALVEPQVVAAVATLQSVVTADAGKAASELSAEDQKAQAQMWAYAGQMETLLKSVVAKMTSLVGVDVGLGVSVKPLVNMAEGWLNQMDNVDEDVQM